MVILLRIYADLDCFITEGTELANKSVVQTIIDTAPDRSKTLAFNYASLALNNSFFLDTLVRKTLIPVCCLKLNHVEETSSSGCLQ